MHAPSPAFGMDIFKPDFQHEGVVLLSNNGNGNKGIPIRCDHFIIVLCLEGEAFRRINHHRFPIKKGSLHIIKPGDIHSFSNTTSDFDIRLLLFERDYLLKSGMKAEVLDALLSFSEDCVPNIELENQDKLMWKSIFEDIDLELSGNEVFQAEIVNGILLNVIARIKRHFHCVEIPESGSRQQDIFLSYKKLVGEHFMEKKTVQEYADLMHISSKHLSETVKLLSGKSALFYIHERIILEAEYLITYTSASISEIAFYLNFDTPSHFGRFFKKQKLQTPLKFRVSVK
ncbi:AraC family transcriptional regulator (plasmid) [Aureibacter tunicatorum]|nr:AraC family transcriptional regulator [Aureibacter tunicatorum]